MSSLTQKQQQAQTNTGDRLTGVAKLNKDPKIKSIFESLEYGPAPESPSSVNAWLDEHDRAFGHFINGKWVKPKGRKMYETCSPATGEKHLERVGTRFMLCGCFFYGVGHRGLGTSSFKFFF